EQEIAELKEEEVQLAEQLMRDFQANENSLMIMGNVLHRHGNAIEALKFMNQALKINPRRADVYSAMGWLSIQKGEFEQAIAHYRKALEIQPNLPNTRSNIAHALVVLGRHDEATKELNREIQTAPDSAFAHFLLGQAYLQQKQYDKARESYEAVIKIDPQYAKAYYGLATVCAKLGNGDGAGAYSEKFRKLKAEERKDLSDRKSVERDDFLDTQKTSALTFIEAGQLYVDAGKLDKAEQLLRRAAGLDPENVVCFREIASLYQKSNQPSKALAMLERASEIEPENPMWYANIAMLSAQLQRFDDAEEAFRKVIAMAPGDSNAYRHLAHLYLRTDTKLAQAKQLAEKAIALEATAANYFVLSLACNKNGDTAGALSAIKRALELEPNNPQCRRLYELILQRK
ncbi:MAG: tetratricopeptide repeat protein, partial [Phycisphaerales bacterium]